MIRIKFDLTVNLFKFYTFVAISRVRVEVREVFDPI